MLRPFRLLWKSPAFAAVAILTLALGIGANTAIFSVIHAVLLRPVPYPEGERLVILTQSDSNQPNISVSFPDYLDWRKDNASFAHLAIARRESFNLSGVEGRDPEQVQGALATANFFPVIGLAPQLGRAYTEAEDRVGGPALVVISHRLWQRVWQGDPNILGRAVNFGGEARTVIGVMPPEMASPRVVDAWFPLMRRTDNPGWQARGNHPGLTGWGRLKPGVTTEQARLEMKGIAARLEQAYPDTNSKIGVNVAPFLENQVGEYRSSLGLLLGAVGLVLLIACANLANLLAARGQSRAREFAVRTAIGAGRGQIIRQLLGESLVIALLGGALGVLIAWLGRDLLVALSPAGVARFQQVRLDWVVLCFAFGLSLLTSVLFGLWPAWQASRADVQLALKSGAHGGSDSRSARRSRAWFIIGEVALTLVLLSAAGLVLKSFARVQGVPLGFEPRGLLTAQVSLPSPAYADDKKTVAFAEALLEKMRALPGVEHAAIGAQPPMMTGWQTSFVPEGAPEPKPGQAPSAEMDVVMGDYFPALRATLLRGRLFDARDREDAPLVMIVDQSFADRWFPGEDPIGKRVAINNDDSGKKFRTIVGVVARMRVYGFDEGTAKLPLAYLPQAQNAAQGLVLLLRTSASPQALEKPLRAAVASLDAAQPVWDLRPMQERVQDTWAAPRLMAFLLGVFAGLALLLSAVGLYGVMAHDGLRRLREIGVRLALGARPDQIRGMMIRHGMRLLLIGVGLGLLGTLAVTPLLQSQLHGVGALDPLVLLGVCAILVLAALLSVWPPARRASKTSPLEVLRAE